MSRHVRPTSGVTMIEVMIVIVIIAILAAVIVPIFATLQFRQQMSMCASDLKTIGQALLMYRSDYLAFPPDHSQWNAAFQMYELGLSQLYYAYWANQTEAVRPDGDDTVSWGATGSPHYAQINEAAQAPVGGNAAEPGGADTATTVSAAGTADNDKVESFDMETLSGAAAVTEVDVWAYCRAAGAGDAAVDIYMPGTAWRPQQDLNAGGEWQWRQVGWVGAWTQGDLDGLRVRFTASTPDDLSVVEVAAMYAVVTWSKLPRVIAAGDYITEQRILHCPRAPADRADFNDWPYLGGYNVYDWNYRRDRSDIWLEQGARRLDGYPAFPPSNTVVTWCPMHRDRPPESATDLGDIKSGDFDLVLWADGSVNRMASRFDQYKAEQP